MRRKSSVLFIMLFITLYFANIDYVFSGTKNENLKEANEENQQVTDKEKKYKWEFSTAASLGVKFHQYPEYLAFFTTTIPVRIGFLFPKNIMEIEAEADFMYDSDYSKIQPFFLIHLIYNFRTSSRIKPFLLAGVGSLSERVRAAIEPYEEFRESYFLWSAGIGLKRFFKDRFALRFDYRFVFFNSMGENIMLHGIFVGGSLFF